MSQTPGLFLTSGIQYSGVVCIQNYRFSIQADIHILRRDRFQVIGHIELDANAFQAMTENLPYRIEVSGKLVHIGCRTVSGIVEPYMR